MQCSAACVIYPTADTPIRKLPGSSYSRQVLLRRRTGVVRRKRFAICWPLLVKHLVLCKKVSKVSNSHSHSPIIARASEDGGIRRMPGHRVHGPGPVAFERDDLHARFSPPDVDAGV